MAGSKAQSAIDDKLEVVARGIPFSNNSVALAVRFWPSKSKVVVEIVSQSMRWALVVPELTVLIKAEGEVKLIDCREEK